MGNFLWNCCELESHGMVFWLLKKVSSLSLDYLTPDYFAYIKGGLKAHCCDVFELHLQRFNTMPLFNTKVSLTNYRLNHYCLITVM